MCPTTADPEQPRSHIQRAPVPHTGFELPFELNPSSSSSNYRFLSALANESGRLVERGHNVHPYRLSITVVRCQSPVRLKANPCLGLGCAGPYRPPASRSGL